jgi:hypothetical protein
MANLPISAETVSYVISLARDIENALPEANADDGENHRGEAADPELITEHEYDTLYQELRGFLELPFCGSAGELTTPTISTPHTRKPQA